jgi:hypothetical protein
MKQSLGNLLILLLLVSAPTFANNKTTTQVYYRYLNEQGIPVMDSSIPPKYVRNGYEVVSLGGEVLRVVPPAPSEEEIERLAHERQLKQEQDKADALIRRRYSNLNDIEAVRHRSLLELQNNIDILQGNLSSTRLQIEQAEAQAASIERRGQTVSEDILKLLTDLRAEERDIQVQIKQRQVEYQSLSDKFDQDKRRFQELMEQGKL